MDIDVSLEELEEEEEEKENRPLPLVGTVWRHRCFPWFVVIDKISHLTIEFHTVDTNDPELSHVKREKENFLEEFSFSSFLVEPY